jgi:predicted transcriptional regulator
MNDTKRGKVPSVRERLQWFLPKAKEPMFAVRIAMQIGPTQPVPVERELERMEQEGLVESKKEVYSRDRSTGKVRMKKAYKWRAA